MGGMAIIGLGNQMARNAASASYLGGLYNALGGTKQGGQPLTSRYIVINGYGETVGPSKHATWTPTIVASWVKKGHIWIDYCGWPMYYQGHANGTMGTLGPSGWHQLADYLGYGWLDQVSFAVPGGSIPILRRPNFHYPFRRGLPIAQSMDGVDYASSSATFHLSTPPGVPDTYPLTDDGYTSVFALHPPNGGYYIYLSYFYSFVQTVKADLVGVPPTVGAQFVKKIIQGDHTGIVSNPYRLSTQHVSTPTPGPSSPITVTTNTATHHPSSSHTARGTQHTTSTTKSGPSHVAEDVLIGGTMATGVGLVAVALLHRHRRTHG